VGFDTSEFYARETFGIAREKVVSMSIAASFIYTSMIFATGYGSIMRDVRNFFQMMGAHDYVKELV